jgi:hypothetical protein
VSICSTIRIIMISPLVIGVHISSLRSLNVYVKPKLQMFPVVIREYMLNDLRAASVNEFTLSSSHSTLGQPGHASHSGPNA